MGVFIMRFSVPNDLLCDVFEAAGIGNNGDAQELYEEALERRVAIPHFIKNLPLSKILEKELLTDCEAETILGPPFGPADYLDILREQMALHAPDRQSMALLDDLIKKTPRIDQLIADGYLGVYGRSPQSTPTIACNFRGRALILDDPRTCREVLSNQILLSPVVDPHYLRIVTVLRRFEDIKWPKIDIDVEMPDQSDFESDCGPGMP